MKTLITIVLLFSGAFAVATPVQPADSVETNDIIQSVSAAIRTGNSSALAAYFSPAIDLTVPGTEGTFSKAQAELIVKGFFAANPPQSFVVHHSGSSGEISQFCIGYLETGDTRFRVYFLVKTLNGISQLTQLQFEEE